MSDRSASPAVSVVIPCYNAAAHVGECVDSVFRQTFKDFEVVVVNDGSPDTSDLERALAPYRDRIVYIEQPNAGVSAARNTAIRASRGRCIAFLDSDDAWEPEYLDVQVAALEASPDVDVVYPNATIVGDHPEAGRTYMDICPSNAPVTVEALLTQRVNVFIGGLIRREALFRAGLFDESLRSVEDFDLWLRLLVQGGRMTYHRRPLVRHRKHRGSLSADPVRMAEHVLTVLDKAAMLPLDAADRVVLNERRAYFRAMLRLTEGKRAFFRRDAQTAARLIAEANGYFRSWRLAIVGVLVRATPGLLLKLYDWRDRLLLGATTRF